MKIVIRLSIMVNLTMHEANVLTKPIASVSEPQEEIKVAYRHYQDDPKDQAEKNHDHRYNGMRIDIQGVNDNERHQRNHHNCKEQDEVEEARAIQAINESSPDSISKVLDTHGIPPEINIIQTQSLTMNTEKFHEPNEDSSLNITSKDKLTAGYSALVSVITSSSQYIKVTANLSEQKEQPSSKINHSEDQTEKINSDLTKYSSHPTHPTLSKTHKEDSNLGEARTQEKNEEAQKTCDGNGEAGSTEKPSSIGTEILCQKTLEIMKASRSSLYTSVIPVENDHDHTVHSHEQVITEINQSEEDPAYFPQEEPIFTSMNQNDCRTQSVQQENILKSQKEPSACTCSLI